MIAALLLAFPCPQEPVNQEAINAAIDRGVVYLGELFDGGKRQKRIDTDRPGMRALILYTLLKSIDDTELEAIDTLLEQLAFDKIEGTYDLALLMLSLAAHDRVQHRPWMEQLAQQMIGWQKDGEWAYPDGTYDLSNTQYAALGLWAAEQCGVKIEPRVWTDLANTLLLYQDEDGAFSYTRPGKGGYGSMTAAGVGTLALCEMYLLRTGNLSETQARTFTAARKRGLDWLDEFFSVETNPKNGGWHYYYLYGLERMGGLAGAPRIGEHDWYAEGAQYLLERQDEEGSWTNGADLSETCFALLFLKRATSSDAPRGPVTGGGKRVDPPKNETEDKTAAVRIAVKGTLPLEMWIDGWGRAKTKPLEWKGETGLGPHVSRVEWLADDEIIEVGLWDARLAAGTARFTAKHLFEKNGTIELVCRVHVQPPDGAAPQVLESPPLEVEIEEALPAWTREFSSVVGTNLVPTAKPSAKGSSTLRKPEKLEPPLPDRKYEAKLAIDGKLRTPWLADLKDKRPKLSLSLRKPQEADFVMITHAQLTPHQDLALPAKLEVRINKKLVHEFDVDPDPMRPVLVQLEKPIRIKSVDVILIDRQGESTSPMGLSEITVGLAKP